MNSEAESGGPFATHRILDEGEHYAAVHKRFPIQPAAALAPRPPAPLVGKWSTTGTKSSVIASSSSSSPSSTTPSQIPTPRSSATATAASEKSSKPKLSGIPRHTSIRADKRKEASAARDDSAHRGGDQSAAAAAATTEDASSTNKQQPLPLPHAGPTHDAAAADATCNNGTDSSLMITDDGEYVASGMIKKIVVSAIKQSYRSTSPRRRHEPSSRHTDDSTSSTALVPVPPSSASTPQSHSHWQVADQQEHGTGGDVQRNRSTVTVSSTMNANTVARVERSEQRKALMEQQLSLERAYWNTKYAFQGLRTQAEQRIYSRELTALWTERTDRSPYWTDQVHGLRNAQSATRSWRRHPEFVRTASAEVRAGDKQLVSKAFDGVAASLLHQDLREGLDHRLAPPVPHSRWTSVVPLYEASVPRLFTPPSGAPPQPLPLLNSPRGNGTAAAPPAHHHHGAPSSHSQAPLQHHIAPPKPTSHDDNEGSHEDPQQRSSATETKTDDDREPTVNNPTSSNTTEKTPSPVQHPITLDECDDK